MRKRFAFLLAALLMLWMYQANASSVYQSGYYTYTILSDDSAMITGYVGHWADLYVPEELDGHPVTTLHKGAFSGLDDAVRIILPNTVTTIEASAFSNCPKLVMVSGPSIVDAFDSTAMYANCSKLQTPFLPDNLTQLGKEAFYNCESLTQIALPGALRTIESSAFEGCARLSKCIIPSTVISVGDRAFAGTAIKEIELPQGLTEMGEAVFAGCDRLQVLRFEGNASLPVQYGAIYRQSDLSLLFYHDSMLDEALDFTEDYPFPADLHRMAPYAFENAKQIKRVTVPDSVFFLGVGLFRQSSLQSLMLPTELTEIPDALCQGCTQLDYVACSSKLTSIGADAFAETSLQRFPFSESLISIGDRAFAGTLLQTALFSDGLLMVGEEAFSDCLMLNQILLPDSLQTVGQSAFRNCKALQYLSVPGSIQSIPVSAFSGCESLSSVTISPGVLSIDENAFNHCKALRNLTIPESVMSIDDAAFNDCRALKQVTVSIASYAEEYFTARGVSCLYLPQ